MKRIIIKIVSAAVAAMAFAGCRKAEDFPAGDTVKVSFSTTFEPVSKVTLEADEDDEVFTPAWLAGDEIALSYDGPAKGTVTAVWDGSGFTCEVSSDIASKSGDWTYTASYGQEPATERSQKGDMFNGIYDRMTGSVKVSGSMFGRNEDKELVIPMTRETGILYFHLYGRGSAIGEAVEKATLKDGETIVAEMTIQDGTALNTAEGHKFWFSLDPGTYEALSLEVETRSYIFRVAKHSGNTATVISKGHLTKIVGEAKSDYRLKDGGPVMGEGVFNSCDWSPYVCGITAGSVPTLDDGISGKCYSYDMTVNASGHIGYIWMKREEPVVPPAGMTLANGMLSFYIHTDRTIDFAASANRQLVVEMTSSGESDKGELQWVMFEGNGLKELKAGEWTKVELPFALATASAQAPDIDSGFNFFRTWIQGDGLVQGEEYAVKLDEIVLSRKSNYNDDGIAAVTGLDGMNFQYTHAAFNAGKTYAYLAADNATLVCINLEDGCVEWTYRHPDNAAKTSGCQTPVCVNPVNGDIYFTNRAKSTYCVTKEGTLKWVNRTIDALGGGLALNGDASILFVAGNGSLVSNEAGSRRLSAVDAETGGIIATKYANTELDGISGSITYTGYAQLLVPDDSHLILWGANNYQVYEFDAGERYIRRIKYVNSNNTTPKIGNVTDYSSPAANRDYAFFPAQLGVLGIVELKNGYNLKTAVLESGKRIYGATLDADGNIYLTNANAHITGYAVSDIVEGGTPASRFVATVGSNDSQAYTFAVPTVSGRLYTSTANGGCCALFTIPMDSSGNVNGSLAVRPPFDSVDYNGVFAMTDGYALVATKSKGTLYIKKLDEQVVPGTWSYCGGDPCQTRNIRWVYGSY